MARPPTNFGQIGRPGLKQYSGLIQEEFLTALQGSSAAKVYDEMESNDPIVNGMLFAVTHLLKRANWSMQPGEGQNEDSPEVFLINSALNDMEESWADTVDEILTMLKYGWSYHEIVYKYRKGPNKNPKLNSRYLDNMIGWRKFGIRSQKTLSRWDIEDATGDIFGLYQSAPPDYNEVYIPIEKALLFRTTTRYNNPEGRSVLRGAYRPWYFKKKIEELEGIGVERDLVGLPVIEVPAELTSPDAQGAELASYEMFKELATRIRRDEQEGIVFPREFDENNNKLYELRLLGKDGGKRDFDTSLIIARYDQRIAMTLLADFILLGHERVGSFALSRNKTHLFSIALESFLESIASPINRFAIPKLLELNGYSTENPPYLKPGVIDTPDLSEVAEFINKLFKSNIVLNSPKDVAYLRGLARMPEMPLSEIEKSQKEGAAAIKSQSNAVEDDDEPPAKPKPEESDGPTADE